MLALALLLATAAGDPVAGTWEGKSLCQVKPSPCQDEHVIYRVKRMAPQNYRLEAYKLVGGRELFMGPIDLKFYPARRELNGSIPGIRGGSNLRLTLKGAHLSGRLTLDDGTLYRLIEVDKR